jgi:Tfp pilus assembly protein PilF
MLTLLIVPSSFLYGGMTAGGVVETLGAASRGVEDISRMDYFLTQYRVVATYIRLLLFPVGQNANYHYPLYESFLNPQVFLSFILFISLIGLGVVLIVRSKRGLPMLRLAGFGVIWFFLTLSVESTIVPLPMIITEYRLYLPSVGAFAAITVALLNINRLPFGSIIAKGLHVLFGKEALFGWTPFRASLSGRTVHKKNIGYSGNGKLFVVLSSAVVITVLIAVTHQRNDVWGSRLDLWQDVVEKSPLAARGHNNLAMAYKQSGMIINAIEHFEIAANLKPDNASIQYNLAQTYRAKGMSDKAIQHYVNSLRIAPDQEKIHNNMGIVYFEKGMVDRSVDHFKMALEIKPDLLPAHLNLALAYLEKGLTEEAEHHFQTVLTLDPRMEKAHFNLGIIYFEKGILDKAHEMFHRALALAPEYVGARRMHDDLHRRAALQGADY